MIKCFLFIFTLLHFSFLSLLFFVSGLSPSCCFSRRTLLLFFLVAQATAEANNLAAVAGAKDLYNRSMEQVRSSMDLLLLFLHLHPLSSFLLFLLLFLLPFFLFQLLLLPILFLPHLHLLLLLLLLLQLNHFLIVLFLHLPILLFLPLLHSHLHSSSYFIFSSCSPSYTSFFPLISPPPPPILLFLLLPLSPPFPSPLPFSAPPAPPNPFSHCPFPPSSTSPLPPLLPQPPPVLLLIFLLLLFLLLPQLNLL